MKMRKKLAALLAAAMIASVMPMSAFADSANRVNKTITVAKDSTIKVEDAPELRIKMKDELTTNLSFYLELTGADWAPMYTGEVKASYDGAATSYTVKHGGVYGGLLELGLIGHNVSAIITDYDDTDAKADSKKEAEKSNTATVTKPSTAKATITSKDKALEFKVNTKNNGEATFEAYRESNTRMAFKLVGTDSPGVDVPFLENDEFIFPLVAKIKDSEAIVNVRKHDTEVSNSEHVFAISDADKAKVSVGKTPKFYRTTTIADITIEELYANSVRDVKESERWFTLELRDTDFTFDPSGAKIVGEIAYREYEEDLSVDNDNFTLSKDGTRLGIKINGTIASARERGNFVLKGVKVVAARDARNGEVKAVIESKELFGKETITIAERGDYKTKLDVPKDWKYEVVAGNEKEVTFTLSEELANSLVGTRPVTFTFDQGVKINTQKKSTSSTWEEQLADNILWANDNATTAKRVNDLLDIIKDTVSSPADKNAALAELLVLSGNLPTRPSNIDNRPGQRDITGLDIITVKGKDVVSPDKDKWSDAEISKRIRIGKDFDSFTVDNFNLDPNKAGQYTFTVPVLVPANVTGEIKVALAGQGVNEEEIVILKAEAPVEVDAETMDIKVGLKEIETTGKITIKETAEARIAQGKNIVLRVDGEARGLEIKSFKATVVEGDLVLEDRKDTNTIVGVKRVSTEPATIEITDIVMSTDRTVPEGKYDLVVGGDALSKLTAKREFAKNDHFDIDPVVVVEDFINITTKNTEDIAGSANKAVVGFTVGADQLLVNGKAEAMDAPPYIKDGNTMVPVRYVATALGVDEDKVIWDGPNQTATIIADKVVQVKLGSKAMSVNGVSVPMNVSAELVNDRTFVPMGAIARALDVRVDWDNDTKTATFNPAK